MIKPMKMMLLGLFVIIVLSLGSLQGLSANDNLVPLVRGSTTVRHYNSTEAVMIPSTYTEKDNEFRGVWVATVFNLNMPRHTSETQYKTAYETLIAQIKDLNMNAILFQVRPLNDAFYASELAPWSRYLTGTEGQDPGWDVMTWMIETAHANGIEFHAWMNPYRVANSASEKSTYLNTLHVDNFARQNPDLVVAGNLSSGLYPYILNPGEPQVRTYIRNVVMELVENYPVDGIHFDDYFYPYSGISSDTHTYDAYKLPGQTIADFRRESVNEVVRDIKSDIDTFNLTEGKDVRFGISPFGIWKSGGADGSNTSTSALQSFHAQYADSKKWVEEGWLHYIAPQVYWPFTHSLAPYADVVDWWAGVARGTGVDVLIGHSIYHAHDNSWLTDEIATQLRYNQKHPEIKGSIMYSAAYLNRAHINHVVDTQWTTMPLNLWDYSPVPSPTAILDGSLDGAVYRSNVIVTVEANDNIYVKLDNGDWLPYVDPFVITTQGRTILYMKAVDGDGVESLVTSTNIDIDKVNHDVPVILIEGHADGTEFYTGSVLTIESASETIWYAINHGAVGSWQPYTGPVVLESTGNHFIRAKTINDEGIESVEVNRLITIIQYCDPDPEIVVEGTGEHPYYQHATISFVTHGNDVNVKINDGSWSSYDEPFVLDTEGTYVIQYGPDDGCLNIQTETVIIDQSPPADPNVVITGDFDDRYYTTETVVELVPDDPSDIIWYRLHNGRSWSSWQLYQEPILLDLSANYMIEYYAKDQAGNESELLDVLIRVNIPPSEDNPFVIRDGTVINYYNTNNPIILPAPYLEKDEEVRAIWVATVFNIDIGLHINETHYKNQIIAMLDRIQALHFNTIFFQVRPMNDAFYDSDYAPWSRYLTGIEGQDPGWDVLGFIIEEAHKRGLELHAWLNPYRVSSTTEPKDQQLALLHDDNFAKQNPQFVLADNNGRLILNPGEQQVRFHLINLIQELMVNYDIDGIHFDDYFYSYGGMSNSQDEATYNQTKLPDQTLADWRRNNVDVLVQGVFQAVEQYNQTYGRNVKFGISPFGIWKSGGPDGSNTSTVTLQSYHHQYADTKKWIEEGWLHYVIPQLYWEFSHHLAPFADLVDWWAELCEEHNVHLIIGQGFYRYADDSWRDESELLEQLRYMTHYDIIAGSAFFSYRTLNSPHAMVTRALERLSGHYWTQPAGFPWPTDVTPPDDEPITCPDGYELEDGACVPVDDPPITCPDGYVLDDGACVPVEVPPQKRGCFGLWTVTRTASLGQVVLPLAGMMMLFGIVIFKRRY